jgi:hypothetical protein
MLWSVPFVAADDSLALAATKNMPVGAWPRQRVVWAKRVALAKPCLCELKEGMPRVAARRS